MSKPNKINDFVFKDRDPEYLEYLEYNSMVSDFTSRSSYDIFISYKDINRVTFNHWKKIKKQIIDHHADNEYINNADDREDIIRRHIEQAFSLNLNGLSFCIKKIKELKSDIDRLKNKPKHLIPEYRKGELQSLVNQTKQFIEEYEQHEAWFEDGNLEWKK